MIWKLAQLGMNVARLNMSHGDHTSHQKTIHFVKQYNSQFQDRVISIMLDTKVKLNQFPFLLYNRIAYIINHLHQTHTWHDTDTDFLCRVLKLEVGMYPNQYYSKRGKHSISLLIEGFAHKILLVLIMMILSMMLTMETYFSSMVLSLCVFWNLQTSVKCYCILEGFIQLLHNHLV
jgi:hypothetical protein